MKPDWNSIPPAELEGNVFELIGSDWMLVTAGDQKGWNTMTASWGGIGVLWGRNVSFVFVRKSRHTYGFMENSGSYSLSFFTEKHRFALNYCGTHSGRDVDKAKEAGITPFPVDGTVAFEEARLVVTCRKIYFQDIDPERFLDRTIARNYPDGDYHRMYVGEIVGCRMARSADE